MTPLFLLYSFCSQRIRGSQSLPGLLINSFLTVSQVSFAAAGQREYTHTFKGSVSEVKNN